MVIAIISAVFGYGFMIILFFLGYPILLAIFIGMVSSALISPLLLPIYFIENNQKHFKKATKSRENKGKQNVSTKKDSIFWEGF